MGERIESRLSFGLALLSILEDVAKVWANAVRYNLFNEIGAAAHVGASINQLIYTDGYGGYVDVRGNAAVAAQSGGFLLATWYGNSAVQANVWSQCCSGRQVGGAADVNERKLKVWLFSLVHT